jgi:light-regulated signal transduction histidine kinase (bacteriophytochrome)
MRWWVLEVKDNGLGIEKDKLLTIFKPFDQINQQITKAYGGLGIFSHSCSRIKMRLVLELYQNASLFCLCFAAEPQR